MRYPVFLFLFSVGLLVITPARAEQIAAVVNKEIITAYDVEARTKLALLSSGLTSTPETRARFAPQMLRALIDERLQLQEARRLRLTIEDKDIAAAIAELEKQNKMPVGGLVQMLQKNNIPYRTMEQQVRANLAWGEVVRARFYNRSQISDDDIAAVVDRLKLNQGQAEYRLAEIFLAIPRAEQASQIEATASRLFTQLQQGGNFPALANQFSDSASSAIGGDIGWVMASDLDKPLDQLVAQMRPGQIAPPVRTADGFTIIFMRERRLIGAPNAGAASINLYQTVIDLTDGRDREEAQEMADDILPDINGCASAEAVSKAKGLGNSGTLGTLKLGDLPPLLQQTVLPLKVGQTSKPLWWNGKYILLTVCQKTDIAMQLPDKERLRDRLRSQKLERLARTYLNELQNTAFIDVRK